MTWVFPYLFFDFIYKFMVSYINSNYFLSSSFKTSFIAVAIAITTDSIVKGDILSS
ncbi:hypothetical protein [Aliarcobacter butzleri]|uniref:hypothetical protein n=1 Tax=Aliarcobacter butzleri TaxID=28197 RepID=UPI0012D39655|nr:hypothetical protein [Aliarcobacter butzleri]